LELRSEKREKIGRTIPYPGAAVQIPIGKNRKLLKLVAQANEAIFPTRARNHNGTRRAVRLPAQTTSRRFRTILPRSRRDEFIFAVFFV